VTGGERDPADRRAADRAAGARRNSADDRGKSAAGQYEPAANRSAAVCGPADDRSVGHPGRAHDRQSGRWLVFGAAFFWGGTATLARSVFRDRHVPPLTVVELRILISCVLLGPWLALRHPAALRVRRADWPYFLTLGVFGVASIQGSYYYSISVLGVGLSILIQYLAPSLIVLYELARGHRVHASTGVAVVGALIGTALLVGSADPRKIHAAPWQWAVSFSAAVFFAFYILYSKRGLARYRPATVLFYTFVVAGALWAIVTPPWRILAAGYDRTTWLLFGALGVFSTLVPFGLFYAGLKRMRAADAGIVATLEPVVATVSAALLLGEGLAPVQWLGAALVLVAAVMASREQEAQEAATGDAEHVPPPAAPPI
jgi:drug/metabolite transporter (DMT)-like permease